MRHARGRGVGCTHVKCRVMRHARGRGIGCTCVKCRVSGCRVWV